ncbi:MaoC family dehydratase [Nocardioides sp. GY 10113]|uniref:FAS1-like dehydratase domain-containing protein n=1 Tax=Nocardioides sp. GY 10113 TaxID=2569761 RepID=UPI0010A89272|nr:MaoC family dehydratase N-terminal domain-containing protein [Nocardioides sp. GY 10113]TIC89309.1 MaoC family dehydratase [Nocardioides sp. GY 10113]
MPIDSTLVGKSFPPTAPYTVTAEAVEDFAAAVGSSDGSGAVPPTFPIVVTFQAMLAFLAAEEVELSRIVHGDQKFTYHRPVRVGDVLTATMEVTKLRQIGGNDIIATTSEITDEAGAPVCTTTATLVHRGGAA